MNRGCDLPMESYRLAKYALQSPCYVCGGPNAYDAELCRHCFAPMALAQQAARQKMQPRIVGVLGSSGVGKTVYLGMMLDMLARRSDPFTVMARGAFSITVQQNTSSALSAGHFPAKTPNEPDQWNWVHCVVQEPRRKRLELILPDMAGEALLHEVEHPGSFPAIKNVLANSSGMLVLLDAIKLVEGNQTHTHFAMKIASFLGEVAAANKGLRRRPTAIVFTKADQVESCFDDPAAFAGQYASTLAAACREHFPVHKFFACGVAGACAFRRVFPNDRIRVPLRIEPRGIVEPFVWLVHETAKTPAPAKAAS